MTQNFQPVSADPTSLFALARRILAGAQKADVEPEPVDVQTGIGRALRHVTSQPGGHDQAQKAALAIGVVEATLIATDAIDAYLCEAQEMVCQALANTDEGARALYAGRFAQLIDRIDETANAATFDGVNLIGPGKDRIEMISPVGAQPRHQIGHIVLMAGERGMGLKLPRNAFKDDASIEVASTQLTRARARLIKAADTFLNQASMLAPYLEGAIGQAA